MSKEKKLPKAGEYWQTRDGRKAYVAVDLVSPFKKCEDLQFPLRGFIEGRDTVAAWYRNGRYLSSEQAADLVAPWRDPVKVAGWVNIYLSHSSEVHATREDAERWAGKDRIVRVYVEGVEGKEP